jgi:hypothetical protein
MYPAISCMGRMPHEHVEKVGGWCVFTTWSTTTLGEKWTVITHANYHRHAMLLISKESLGWWETRELLQLTLFMLFDFHYLNEAYISPSLYFLYGEAHFVTPFHQGCWSIESDKFLMQKMHRTCSLYSISFNPFSATANVRHPTIVSCILTGLTKSLIHGWKQHWDIDCCKRCLLMGGCLMYGLQGTSSPSITRTAGTKTC